MKITSKPSPNYTRGRTAKISKVIIHHTAGEFAPSVAHLRNPKSQVSAHYIINRSGTEIRRLVPENSTSWHARQANPFSIGIEHTSTYKSPFKGYAEAAKLVADICKRHNLNPKKAVEPHSKYVATRCPDSLNWKKIRDNAYIIWKGEDMYKGKTAKEWFSTALGYDKRIKNYQKNYIHKDELKKRDSLISKLETELLKIRKQLHDNQLLTTSQNKRIMKLEDEIVHLKDKKVIIEKPLTWSRVAEWIKGLLRK